MFLILLFQDAHFCDFIRQKFKQNLDWIDTIYEAQEGRSSSYWRMANLFHLQLEGLRLGWLMRAR